MADTGRKVLWFFAIWLSSVMALGVVGGVIKLVLGWR